MTLVRRITREVEVVAFERASGVLPPAPRVFDERDLSEFRVLAPSDAAGVEVFQKWALCPACDRVFALANGDLAHADAARRDDLIADRADLECRLEQYLIFGPRGVLSRSCSSLGTSYEPASLAPRARRHRDEKERLKRETPREHEPILRTTAQIKKLESDHRALRNRTAPPQLWCPRCLNRDFDLARR